jgi:histidine triad (HIT) family protein
MKKDCAFCTLPEIKAREIAGNDLVWAMPTNIPVVVGHTLLMPRRCVAKYEELTLPEREALEGMRQKVVSALGRAFGAEGFNFAWNDGKMAGQSVPHFHLHVLPRKTGDQGIYEYEPRKFLYRPGERAPSPEAELIEVASHIRKNLG